MRTLLTDPFPPQFTNEKTFSADAEPSRREVGKLARTFPQAAALTSEGDLLEVGVGGTVIVPPGAAAAEETAAALEHGVAVSGGRDFPADDLSSFSPRAECESVKIP
ncbi:MAG TPA: hypothetical protein VH597_08470 [Verrucomicrobiae bacterium]|jgi:hypothetical protein|nr:hypothetical protein [Verrucomicrobiae bacterium]